MLQERGGVFFLGGGGGERGLYPNAHYAPNQWLTNFPTEADQMDLCTTEKNKLY